MRGRVEGFGQVEEGNFQPQDPRSSWSPYRTVHQLPEEEGVLVATVNRDETVLHRLKGSYPSKVYYESSEPSSNSCKAELLIVSSKLSKVSHNILRAQEKYLVLFHSLSIGEWLDLECSTKAKFNR